MKNFCYIFTAILLLGFLSLSANALPRFTLMSGQPCMACHVNPTGGAMRNSYGTQMVSMGDLPMWRSDSFEVSTRLTPNISFGADTRAQMLSANSLYNFSATPPGPGAGGTAFQPMQASIYLNVDLTENISVYIKNDFITSGGFEFWGIARILPNDGYIKVGAFQPAIGLRVDDHTSFTRDGDYTQDGKYWGFGIYPNSKDVGLEVGEYFDNFFVCASVTNGEFPLGNVGAATAAPNFTPNKAFTGRLEYTNLITDDIGIMLGASGFVNDSLNIYGGFGGIRVGVATITADYEMGKNLTSGGMTDTTNANALMMELSVKIIQGLYGTLKYDSFTPDQANTSANNVARWTIGAEWYPVNFVEIIPQFRMLKENSTAVGATASTANTLNEFLLQLHLWI